MPPQQSAGGGSLSLTKSHSSRTSTTTERTQLSPAPSLQQHLQPPARSGALEPGAAPHPFPVTVAYLTDGIKRLRAVHAVAEDAYDAGDYWRGMRDVEVLDDFYSGGGTELAPMSTSRDLNVALHYSAKAQVRLIFKIATDSFMSRGASLLFLSAFPDEVEFLYPPLTFLQPTGRCERRQVGETRLTVLEVSPHV